jgi:NAD(P)-dependent dehydrogenase (short-subunit alcohol dehydrogenase family)
MWSELLCSSLLRSYPGLTRGRIGGHASVPELGLTRSVARDYADAGIRVNAVGPGPIHTPFHGQRAHDAGVRGDEYRAQFGAQTMLKRPADPSEVANAIAFLASTDALFITGTCLYVDGGSTAAGDL